MILAFHSYLYAVAYPTPVSLLHKSIAGRYRPVRAAGGPITARCRFIKNASWDSSFSVDRSKAVPLLPSTTEDPPWNGR